MKIKKSEILQEYLKAFSISVFITFYPTIVFSLIISKTVNLLDLLGVILLSPFIVISTIIPFAFLFASPALVAGLFISFYLLEKGISNFFVWIICATLTSVMYQYFLNGFTLLFVTPAFLTGIQMWLFALRKIG